MDQQQIDKLRAAGYTDDDIRDFTANQPSLGNAPTQTTAETLPEIDVTKPSDTLKQAEAQGIPTGARESSFLSDVATAAPVVIGENAGKIALGLGGAGGVIAANQVRKGMQARAGAQSAQAAAQMAQAQAAMQAAQQAAQSAADNQQLQRERMAERAARNAKPGIQILDAQGRPYQPAQPAPRPVTPVVPQGPANIAPVVPGAGPAPMPAPAGPAPSLLDKTTSMIRQLAANKVVQGLAKGANVLGGAQIAAYSPELGPKTPQVGRMRGMEINPLTNAPWTPEQIKQYEANPNVYDAQMAAPQMRR